LTVASIGALLVSSAVMLMGDLLPRGVEAHSARLLQAAAFILLLWPTVSLAIDRASLRRPGAWIPLALYAAALLSFMGAGHSALASHWTELLAPVQIVLLIGLLIREVAPLLPSDQPQGRARAA
jgi:hypothetical protein